MWLATSSTSEKLHHNHCSRHTWYLSLTVK
jgi:hypothetical protein